VDLASNLCCRRVYGEAAADLRLEDLRNLGVEVPLDRR
jgi:hypothetical protein